MKIALISSVAIKTPPLSYGGLERVVYDFATGLEKLGHEVTLIAAKGSVAPKGVRLLETVKAWNDLTPEEQQGYGKADGVQREWNNIKWLGHTYNGWRAHEEDSYSFYKDLIPSYDVIGDHSWSKWSYQSKKDEIVSTNHSMKSYQTPPPREFPMFVGVSRQHSHLLSRELHIPVRTAWNPVNIQEFTVQKEKQDRALSLNRIMPQKGIHKFVSLVNDLKVKADIAGDDSTLVPDQNYVQWIKDQCKQSASITYHGLVTDQQRRELLQNAKVTVCLKDGGYEEVFGLQAVESLAAGTPVVAERSWGFEDTIISGQNGFLCDSMDQVKDAVRKIMNGTVKIDPDVCRKSAERFSRENSSKMYENLLTRAKASCRW